MGEWLLTIESCISEPREWGRRQTEPTPRNKLARPDVQRGKEEEIGVASPARGNLA